MKNKVFIIVCQFYLLLLPCCTKNSSVVGDNGDKLYVDGPPVYRSEALLTANEYCRVRWTMSAENKEGVNCGGRFVSDYSLGDRIGMGYKWGGWDTGEDFIEKIESGFGTGTGGSVSYQEYPFDCVTGISCTGLVSRAWYLNKKYTLNYNDPNIDNKFEKITQKIEGAAFSSRQTANLKKGDAFINNYHIILFVYETRDGKPMVMDSRLQGVSFREESWAVLSNQGYSAIRYNNIKEKENPDGTITNPILINSDDFPFFHSGNTRDVVSMEFDSYSIEPTTNEQGPETVYLMLLIQESDIRINVTDFKNEGISNNVHLLTSLRKNFNNAALNCIAKDDTEIILSLEAGSYYIIVDSGNDLPGEYTLSVRAESQ